MNHTIKQWLKAAGIRAAKTTAQTALSLGTVGQAFLDVNWFHLCSVSAMAGIVSILTSLAGLPELNTKPTEREDI